MASRGDQLEIAALRCPRVRIVHRERTQYLAIPRNEWFRPGCGEAMSKSQVASVIWPSRIFGNIRNNHPLLGERSRAARSPVGTDRPRCDGGGNMWTGA